MSESPKRITEQLKAERIQTLLERLPTWELRRDGRAIRRIWSVPSRYVGSAFASALASVIHYHKGEATMTLTEGTVVVNLSTAAVDAVTERDFLVAEALEFGA